LLKRSADLDPAGAPYSDLGALYTHLGRYDDAEKVLRKGHDQDPYDATVRVELGNVYLQMGRTKDAITQLKEACAIDPEATRPIGALALALCKSGDLLEALRVLRDAIRRQDPSGAPALRVMLSRVLTELGDKTDDAELYDQALKEARLAIAAQPGDAEANFNAGIACFKQSNYPAAIKHFNRCCELDKNNFEAEQNLRKLKILVRDEHIRTRIGTEVGNVVALICLVLLILLWTIYLRQPLPATKETIRQIDSTMLLTMSPILLALIFVSLLMPWLTKLKLPGGVEAELTQPKEQISRGPSGPLTLNTGSSGFSSGH
jgi:tetratricopeptide (TPR) repeat protein